MMAAADLMIREVISVRPDSSIKDLLLLFSNHKVSGVPVLDQDRHLVGMVTVGDVIRHMQPHFAYTVDLFTFVTFYVEQETLPEIVKQLIAQPVSTIMTKRHLATVEQDTDIERVLAIFAEQRFKKLPVKDGHERVVGVISRGELVRYIVSQLLQE